MAELKESIENATVIERGISPLMVNMLSALEDFVALDMPFKTEKREQALEELNAYPLDQLDDPVDEPYAAYATKYGALLFCAHHEMLHAGQIGLLRRLLGNSPIR